MAQAEHLLNVKVVTSNGIVYDHMAKMVDVRAVDGKLSIMFNHTPLLTPLAIDDVMVTRSTEMDDRVDHIAVNGGYLEFSNNVLTIISDTAERARNIDLDRAEAARLRAEKRIENADQEHDESKKARAEIALRRAVNRITVYNRYKH
ncbi:MAG: F0F1 ATP synthase subunit epsilon [Lactobacillus sp.]|nr:F0F1 ATP synthase subunit epsilon [Lactobacillus sp.]